MSYPTIDAHRFLYNQDGTRVGYNTTDNFQNGITDWLTEAQLNLLQDGAQAYINSFGSQGGTTSRCFFFFFPEEREITWANLRIGAHWTSGPTSLLRVKAEISNDTTDGIDGAWEEINVSSSIQNGLTNKYPLADWWRNPERLPLLAGAPIKCKALRFSIYTYYGGYISNIHLYGQVSHADDDIIFLQGDGVTPHEALHDFKTTEEDSIHDVDMHIQNTSSQFTAEGVKVEVGGRNGNNISISLDGILYEKEVNIPSLEPGATRLIKVRNTVGGPPQSLMPRSAYLRATTENWT